MSAEAMGDCWRRSPLRGEELLVHLAIADVANDVYEYRFWMTRPALADKARTSLATTSRALARLVRDGWLVVLVPGGGRGKATEYRYQLGGKPSQGEMDFLETVSPESETVSNGEFYPLLIPRTQVAAANGAAGTKPRKGAHTPWPADFEITDALLDFAARNTPDVDVRMSMMALKRWALAGNVKQANWQARAEAWLISDQERVKARGPSRTYL